ncbi:MAG: Ig-like domain-containing protein [Longimicrobiales bacterium]
MCSNGVNRRLWTIFLSIVVALGCERETSTAPFPVTPRDTVDRIARIVIVGPTSSLRVGDSTQFIARVMNQYGGAMEGQSVQWASSDSSIANVDKNGFVHGKKVGYVTITASVGDKFDNVGLVVAPGACTQASQTIGIGETRSGSLRSETACLLNGEPADGWQFTVTAPALLQIDVTINLYFRHLVLTDAELRPLAQAEAVYTAQGLTLRRELAAGSYIVWILADSDDGDYAISIKPAQ